MQNGFLKILHHWVRRSLSKANMSEILRELEFATHFVHYLSKPASIKESKTGNYVFANELAARAHGVNHPNELLGFTINDFADSHYAAKMNQLDDELVQKKQPINDESKILVQSGGFLCLHTTVKIPVYGKNDHVQWILTFCDNWTNKLTDCELFNLYLSEYHNKKIAIQLFLQHLGIDKFFELNGKQNNPSEKQVLVLLALAEHGNYKLVARALNLAYKTVDSNIVQIRNKLVSASLDSLIAFLRKKKWLNTML